MTLTKVEVLIFFLSKALHREGKTEGGMTRLSSYDLEPNSVDERGRDGARQFCWERQEKEILYTKYTPPLAEKS